MNNNLKKYRKEKNLTQKQVAEQLGMQCEDRISHWEKGQSVPSIQNLFKLCRIYSVDPREIYPEG